MVFSKTPINEYYRKPDDFLPTLLCIFKLAKWFGIPPYGGKFSMCWALIIFVMLACLEIGAIWKLIRLLTGVATDVSDGGFVARLSGSIFYGNALLSHYLSWRVISAWKHIAMYWGKAETTGGLYFPPDGRIKMRVVFVTSLVAVCACVEHMMSMMSATGFDFPFGEYFQRYILSSHGFLILPHEYNLYMAIPVFILNKFATIFWNFQDLIIILISMGLSCRYHRMNSYVNYIVKVERRDKTFRKFGTELHIHVLTWRRLREAYVRQSALVRLVDRQLGCLVLLSNMNNFYFICLQLFLGLNSNKRGNIINRVYYLFSTSWLLFRAGSVMLAASDVNVHSRQALTMLNGCPGPCYNVEVKRLKNQLTHDAVALSGMGLFFFRRRLILQVAAAILTYELVMIQYDRN